MAHDGKLLARARKALEQDRAANQAEQQRRTENGKLFAEGHQASLDETPENQLLRNGCTDGSVQEHGHRFRPDGGRFQGNHSRQAEAV